jgi:hypothetical protein
VVGSGAVVGSGQIVGRFAVGREATASAPNTSVAGRGAAAPQRSRREARTAARSGLRSIGQPTIEHLFDVVKGQVARHTGHRLRSQPAGYIPAGPAGPAAGSGGRATLSPGDRPQRVRSASRGDVAQPEEHRVRIAGVRGSSPLISTTSHDIGIPNLLSGGP